MKKEEYYCDICGCHLEKDKRVEGHWYFYDNLGLPRNIKVTNFCYLCTKKVDGLLKEFKDNSNWAHKTAKEKMDKTNELN